MGPATSEAIPASVGRYELLFRIASGGMAEVYAGRVRGEAGFQKLVAVKRMLPQIADDEEFVTMFLDEARVAAHIDSPHCVHTLDLGRAEDGSLYIVMELVVGVTLARILRFCAQQRRAIPVPIAVELLAQAAQGLDDAHEATTPLGVPLQIVHRDVSPQNILVGVDGRVRLTDFGVARAVMRRTETVAGRIKGKFAYSSPEQLMGTELDRRSDVFALGTVGWELLTGQRLFVGDHPMETMERVRSMPIPLVHQLRPDVPPEISAVVAGALDRDVSGRCATAGVFAEQLRHAIRGRMSVPSKADVVGFVRSAGGDALSKIRENIKLALRDKTGQIVMPEAQELLLTPSGVQSAVQTLAHTRDSTDPTSMASMPDLPMPDASVPSAVAGPSSLLPGALAQEKAPRGPSRLPWLIGALAVVMFLVGMGGAAYLLSGDPEEPALLLPADRVGGDRGGGSAPPPQAGLPAASDPGVEEVHAEGAPPAAVAGEAQVDPAATERARRRPSPRDRRRPPPVGHTGPQAVAVVAPPPAPAMTAPAPVTTQGTESRPSPTTMQGSAVPVPTAMGGLVGIDAFDRDVQQMR